jgi:hypothetical protein
VAHQDERTGALLDIMHPDSVGGDESVLKLCHDAPQCLV